MKQRIKIVPVAIYKRGVCVFLGTREQLKEYARRENIDLQWEKEDVDGMLDKSQAVTFRLNTDVLIYAERPMSAGVLVHEIIHAAKCILRFVDVQDEEAEAYLAEYLYNEISPWLEKVSPQPENND